MGCACGKGALTGIRKASESYGGQGHYNESDSHGKMAACECKQSTYIKELPNLYYWGRSGM
jgi:hypothetical protein